MKDFWKKIWQKLKKPTPFFLAVTYILTLVFIGAALTLVVLMPENTALQILAYVSYGGAAIFLTYTVYTLIPMFPRAKRAIKDWLSEIPLTARMMENYGFRTVFFSAFSLFVSTAYGIYNAVIAIVFRSVWYGALATYYLLLIFMRGGIVLYHRRHRGAEREYTRDVKSYRTAGILLMVTILALSAAIAQMVAVGASFEKHGLMIYVAASYTFYKMTMSIVNIVKARKQTDYTVRALRHINFADALVSILALQTAMMQEFSDGTGAAVANGLTGAGVCLIVFCVGLIMLIQGQKILKATKENTTEDAGNE